MSGHGWRVKARSLGKVGESLSTVGRASSLKDCISSLHPARFLGVRSILLGRTPTRKGRGVIELRPWGGENIAYVRWSESKRKCSETVVAHQAHAFGGRPVSSVRLDLRCTVLGFAFASYPPGAGERTHSQAFDHRSGFKSWRAHFLVDVLYGRATQWSCFQLGSTSNVATRDVQQQF